MFSTLDKKPPNLCISLCPSEIKNIASLNAIGARLTVAMMGLAVAAALGLSDTAFAEDDAIVTSHGYSFYGDLTYP